MRHDSHKPGIFAKGLSRGAYHHVAMCWCDDFHHRGRGHSGRNRAEVGHSADSYRNARRQTVRLAQVSPQPGRPPVICVCLDLNRLAKLGDLGSSLPRTPRRVAAPGIVVHPCARSANPTVACRVLRFRSGAGIQVGKLHPLERHLKTLGLIRRQWQNLAEEPFAAVGSAALGSIAAVLRARRVISAPRR